MSALDTVVQKAQDIIDNIKAKLSVVSSRIPFSAAWTLIQEAIAQIVIVIEQNLQDTAGKDKKEIALTIVGQIIDLVVNIIDIPFIPEFVEKTLDVAIRSILLAVASGSIDALVSTFHATGIFTPYIDTGATQTPPPILTTIVTTEEQK